MQRHHDLIKDRKRLLGFVEIIHLTLGVTDIRHYKKGRPGLVRPRGMFGMWLYLACKLRYGAGKHIWRLLVTSLST